MELLKAKKQNMALSRKAPTVKFPMNTSRWRILPGWDKEDPVFYQDFGQHFIKDSTGELKAIYVCVDKTFGKPCQICSALSAAIKNTSDDATLEILNSAKSAGRVLVNAIRMDGEVTNEPVILEMPPSVFESVLNLMLEWEADVMLDLKKGMDIIVERTGSGKMTKYSVTIASKSKSVDPSVMTKVANLKEYVTQESEEKAQRALASVNAIAGVFAPISRGVLAAPSPMRDITPESLVIEEEDDAEDAALRELEEEATKRKVAAAEEKPVKAATVKAAAPVESTGNESIDDMLAELERDLAK
jgi:hypothetical protein